jgi:hypothetical protein
LVALVAYVYLQGAALPEKWAFIFKNPLIPAGFTKHKSKAPARRCNSTCLSSPSPFFLLFLKPSDRILSFFSFFFSWKVQVVALQRASADTIAPQSFEFQKSTPGQPRQPNRRGRGPSPAASFARANRSPSRPPTALSPLVVVRCPVPPSPTVLRPSIRRSFPPRLPTLPSTLLPLSYTTFRSFQPTEDSTLRIPIRIINCAAKQGSYCCLDDPFDPTTRVRPRCRVLAYLPPGDHTHSNPQNGAPQRAMEL